MIEEIVRVSSERCNDSVAEFELLMQTEGHSPRTGTPQQVFSGDAWIGENICAHGRRGKCVGIEELIPHLLFVVTNDQRPIPTGEIANRVDGTGGNVARTDITGAVETIIATPIWCKCGAALGEHLEGCLPSANHGISPTGHSTS